MKIPQEDIEAILTKAVQTLAHRHQLPNLSREDVKVELDAKWKGMMTWRKSLAEIPTGQLAAIVKNLTVNVTAYYDTLGKRFWVNLQYQYDHVGGGSNGYRVDYAVVTADRFGGPDFLDLIESSLYHHLRSEAFNEVRRDNERVAEPAKKG